MDTTTNLELKKPGVEDHALIGDINDNMDTIDEAIGALSETVTELTPYQPTRQNTIDSTFLEEFWNGTAMGTVSAEIHGVADTYGTVRAYDIKNNVTEQVIEFADGTSKIRSYSDGTWHPWTANPALVSIVDSGAKNVLSFTEIGTNNSHGSTFTSNGVSWTLNADGTVTATRTEASATDSSCNLRIDTGSLYVDDYCTGEYVLSGCPTGGGEDTYSLRALRGDDYRVTDTGNGVVLPAKGASTDIYINMLFDKLYDGTVTFKPMICTKAAWGISRTHQPYRPSYQALYDMVKAIQSTT